MNRGATTDSKSFVPGDSLLGEDATTPRRVDASPDIIDTPPYINVDKVGVAPAPPEESQLTIPPFRPKLKTLADLQEFSKVLEEEVLVSQKSAVASVKPATSKLTGFAGEKVKDFTNEKVMPIVKVAAIGVGLIVLTKAVSGLFSDDENKEDEQLRLSEAQLAFLAAQRQEQLEEEREQKAAVKEANASGSWVSIIRGFLPFLKVLFPLAQSAFAIYTSIQAKDIAEEG